MGVGFSLAVVGRLAGLLGCTVGAGGSDPRPTTFQTLLKISPLTKPPMIPATMATGLYNNVIIAASIHSITAQLARSTPAGNASGRS